MGIAHMTFVEISGPVNLLDDVLEHCVRFGGFQPAHASRLGEYAVGMPALQRNPWSPLLARFEEIARLMSLQLSYDSEAPPLQGQDRRTFAKHVDEWLDLIETDYPELQKQLQEHEGTAATITAALELLSGIQVGDLDFDELFSSRFLKIRFGRIPSAPLQNLEASSADCWSLHPLGQDRAHTWCIYAAPLQSLEEADETLRQAGFERLRLPDFVHGTPEQAMHSLRAALREEHARILQMKAELEQFILSRHDELQTMYSQVTVQHSACDLRQYAVYLHGSFHVVGHVLTHQKNAFLESLQNVPRLLTQAVPACKETRLTIPVQLQNNRFTRPFELFVQMYGSPAYGDMDPTPFVAWTYTLLFGLMFGDVGQGLCIALLGLWLSQKQGMALGGIMARIGISSALFGVLYGSVFGFEHLLDPFYHSLGLPEKPLEIMRPQTTSALLLAAVALGAVLILTVILFNICIGLRRRDYERALFSQNGLAGLVFYGAALFAAAMAAAGRQMLTPWYIAILLVLPLLVIFLRQPAGRLIHIRATDATIHRHRTLLESTHFTHVGDEFPSLFSSPHVVARFGRIPTASYRKLHFYTNEPFLLYPIKTDRDYIWCIYLMAPADKKEIDAVFQDLYFERIYIPAEELTSAARAESFIRECMRTDAPEDSAPAPIRGLRALFPNGVGESLTESFFELFEVLLSFVSNTMSFLRVGGFVLSHAGMMSVVFTLSSMVSAGASPFVIVFGNLFVMCLEGLIVGIQALRLEFYELFSRFFEVGGEPFAPVRAGVAQRRP